MTSFVPKHWPKITQLHKPPKPARENRDLKSKWVWEIQGVYVSAYTKGEARALYKKDEGQIPKGAKIVKVRELPQLRSYVHTVLERSPSEVLER